MDVEGEEFMLFCPYVSDSENRKKAEPMVETDFRSLIIIIMLKVHPQNIGCFLLMRAFKDAPDVSKGMVGEILTLG